MVDQSGVRAMLDDVAAGRKTPDEAMAALAVVFAGPLAGPSGGSLNSATPIEDIGFAQIDHDRADRVGFPEVVYGEGKTASQVAEIAARVHAIRTHVAETGEAVIDADSFRPKRMECFI